MAPNNFTAPKKLLVPMAFFAWHELPFAVGSYTLTGRFNPEHEFEDHATIREVELGHEIEDTKKDDGPDDPQVADLEIAKMQERVRIVGSGEEWDSYREQFDSIVTDAVDDHILAGRQSLSHTSRISVIRAGRISTSRRVSGWRFSRTARQLVSA